MVEYSKVNAKLFETQLKKLKTALKRKTGITLRMSSKMFDENNLPHELLLTARQETRLRNAFNNNMLVDIKLSRTQISKIIQSEGFLGSLLSKLAGPSIKFAVPLAKNILALLGIRAAASAIDAGIQKKIHGLGTITLIISNEEMNSIIKITQILESFNIFLEGVTKAVRNETKRQEGSFLETLVGSLGSILLGSLSSGKGLVRAGFGNKKGKGIVRDSYEKRNFIFNAASSF